MPQVVELPPIGQAIAVVVRACRDMPAKEPFRDLRARLRAAKLWDRDRPAVLLRFLGVGGAVATPSALVQALAAAKSEDDIAFAILDRVWQLNPLLGKTVVELVAQRAYHKDEIYKHLASSAYRGVVPSRPALETWLQIALACGLLRPLGVAVAIGPRGDRYAQLASAVDVDELLAAPAEPEPVIPPDDDAAPAEAAPESSIPVAAAAPPSPLPAPLRHLSIDGASSPRNRERPVPVARFAAGFAGDVLADTAARIASWWDDAKRATASYEPADFGLDTEAWVERPDEVLYRIAVAAALAFRLDRDRTAVIASYGALDRAGVLADLYQGTVPETLPAQPDARALMLASLAARRCAEIPELAARLDCATAADAFAALDAALGRGLFRTELFWILDQLARLGVVRYPDLADYTTTPHRIVRDTLFRLGFLDSPYASDAPALALAAKAARRAVPNGPADEVLATFALAAGCAYDCTHRKTCDFACRERLE